MKKRKVVINECHGGFSLSRRALHALRELGNAYAIAETDFGESFKDGSGVRDSFVEAFLRDIPRDDPHLVEVVRLLKKDACGWCAALKIVSIPADVEWEIQEYDGAEWIAEKHRTWS